jgi:hypothetical protein
MSGERWATNNNKQYSVQVVLLRRRVLVGHEPSVVPVRLVSPDDMNLVSACADESEYLTGTYRLLFTEALSVGV